MTYLQPDPSIPGAFRVMFGTTQQSWVDPSRPDFLVFEYVQEIANILDNSVLHAPSERRLRVVHIGGGGLSIPRWIEWRRPQTAQVVCEPNTELTDEVRRKAPLPNRSGIKVRDVDGRAGLAAMRDDWADVIIVDAFDGSQVPAELVSVEAFDEYRRVLRGDALVIVNVTDQAPFSWAKRVAAAMGRWPARIVGAEPAVHKGRRFGNVLLVGADVRPDEHGIARASAGLNGGYRWLVGREGLGWSGGAEPFTDATAVDSPKPATSRLWF